HQKEPLGFFLTVIQLPPTHWTMSYPFLEVEVFCREMIKHKNYWILNQHIRPFYLKIRKPHIQ
ncbi:hypothetical protein, partial [Bacillus pretiosus]|uniref:hypothetical protein n=1 Tax=Bacillus pretiosus TaxID=2983392 RepID=UPI003D65FAB6